MLAAAAPDVGQPAFPPVYYNGATQDADLNGGKFFDDKTGASYPAIQCKGEITIPNISTFNSNGLDGILVYKVTSQGVVAWTTSLQLSTAPGNPFAYVGGPGALDTDGNFWITGAFYGSALQIPGLAPLVGVTSEVGLRTAFVAKFDAATGSAILAFTVFCSDPTNFRASMCVIWLYFTLNGFCS